MMNFIQILCVLTPAIILHSLGMDIFVSCLPQMQDAFMATQTQIQTILTIFMFATGFGQPFVGPLSDRYGRRPVILAGIFCFSIGSILCIYCPTLPLLVLARFIQGLGACATCVACYACVRDQFQGQRANTIYSCLNAGNCLAPLLAPILGGYLSFYFGSWKASFIFLASFGVVAFHLALVFLPETAPSKTAPSAIAPPSHLSFFETLVAYKTILQNKTFWLPTTFSITALTVFFLYFSLSSFLLVNHLGVLEHHFGGYFAINGLAIFIAFLSCPTLFRHLGFFGLIRLGIRIIFFGAILMIAWHYFFGLTKIGFVIPSFIATFGAGIIFSPCMTKALSPFKYHAGKASAAYGALLYGVSGLFGTLAMSFPIQNTLNLGITLLILSSINLISLPQLKRLDEQNPLVEYEPAEETP